MDDGHDTTSALPKGGGLGWGWVCGASLALAGAGQMTLALLNLPLSLMLKVQWPGATSRLVQLFLRCAIWRYYVIALMSLSSSGDI